MPDDESGNLAQSRDALIEVLALRAVRLTGCESGYALQLPPALVVKASWLQEYEQDIKAIWDQLVRFNTTLRVLEKLLQFRFDLFVEGNHIFWQTVEAALTETCVMVAWRIAVDTSNSAGLPLQRLKNEILLNMATEAYKASLKLALRQANFEKSIASVTPKIEELRHNYFAHFNREKHTKPTQQDLEMRKLLLSDFLELRDNLNALFRILCFGNGKSVLPWDYDEEIEYPAGTDGRTDVECLLDGIASEGSMLNLPERNAVLWAAVKRSLSPTDLLVINRYRSKFGLETA